MIEHLIVFGVVALAAAWAGWALILRSWFSRRAKGKPGASCGGACHCGD